MSNERQRQGEITRALGVTGSFEVEAEVERRVDFLVQRLADGGLTTLVLGISGGVDSAAAGALCILAAERRRAEDPSAQFVAMQLPYGAQADAADAQLVVETLGPDRALTVDVKPASDAAVAALEGGGLGFASASQRDFVLGNIKARQRMIAQYAVAGACHGLVVGTDHAAEAVTGFFTKYGDGGADVVPLAGLTKRRVRRLAEHLGVPSAIVSKTPTADLHSLQPRRPDEDELGLSYDDIDDFLEGRTVADGVAASLIERYETSMHKRTPPAGP